MRAALLLQLLAASCRAVVVGAPAAWLRAAAPSTESEVVAAPGSWPSDPFAFNESQCGASGNACHGMSLGNHRVEIEVSAAAAAHRAVVVRVAWRRRLSPRVGNYANVIGVFSNVPGASTVLTNTTVINSTATSALIAFEPSFGAGAYCFYYLPYTFSGGSGSYSSVFGGAPAPTVCPPRQQEGAAAKTEWRPNNATSLQSSQVRHSSGQVWAANAAWKAADGDLRFEMTPNASVCSTLSAGTPQPAGVSCQGWDGLQGWPEFIIFDLGACHTVDGFALFVVGDRAHDPHAMTLDVSDTDDPADSGWRTVANLTGAPGVQSQQTFYFEATNARFWRWQILDTCCVVDTYQSFVNETLFRTSEPLPEAGPAGAWKHAVGLIGNAAAVSAAAASLPAVAVARFSARTEFDRFTDMERMASPSEVDALLISISNRGLLRDYLLFPEHREFAVRDTEGIPLRWVRFASEQCDVAAHPTLAGTVEPDEFFVFQIGVLSTSQSMRPVTVLGYDLVSAPDFVLALNCFSLEGNSYEGHRFTQNVTVQLGRVGSLWWGVNVSTAAQAGEKGWLGIRLRFADGTTMVANVTLAVVSSAPLEAHGDRNASRLSRLRWLDSKRWLDYTNSRRYTPLHVSNGTVELLNRRIELGGAGLPLAISSNGHPVLDSPINLSLVTASGQLHTVSSPISSLQVTQLGPGAARWSSSWSAPAGGELHGLSVRCVGELSSDGFLELNLTIATNGILELQDIWLQVPLAKATARWIMGLDVSPSGRFGVGSLPDGKPEVDFAWANYGVDPMPSLDGGYTPNLRSSVWLGKANAGLRVKFKGPESVWNSPTELPKLPPMPWANCKGNATTLTPSAYRQTCAGRVTVFGDARTDDGSVMVESRTGPVTLAAGSLPFVLDLMVTPMHPVDSKQHLATRYVHLFGNVQTKSPLGGNPSGTLEGLVALIASMGGTWVILHQGTSLNTFINSPINDDIVPALGKFVELCAAHDIRVKLYFTTRELTNRAPELFAIKALPGNEIIRPGIGGGGAWLQEHLGHDEYAVGWSSVNYVKEENGSFFGLDALLPGVRADEAVLDSGVSRWNNWYVEGVHYSVAAWPLSSGLYCDGIAFDRHTMQRVRKGMEAAAAARPGGDASDVRVDLHSGNGGGCKHPGYGSPALQNMQHLSFVDSLWFGEGFDYWGQSADWWLLEASGILFGLTGEMIREAPIGPDGGQSPACGGYYADPNRWLGAVFMMTSRICAPNLKTNPEVVEGMAVQNYWQSVRLGERVMVGWWDDSPLLHTSDGEVKATAWLHINATTTAPTTPSLIIALGNFKNESVTITLSGSWAMETRWRAVAIDSFQVARLFEPGEPIPIVAKRGWMLESVE